MTETTCETNREWLRIQWWQAYIMFAGTGYALGNIAADVQTALGF